MQLNDELISIDQEQNLMTIPGILIKALKYMEAMEAIEQMCNEGGDNPEFRIFRSPHLPEKWLATLAERESKPNISADGETMEEAVINLRKAMG